MIRARPVLLVFLLPLFCATAGEAKLEREASARLLAVIDFDLYDIGSLCVGPDRRRVAYVQNLAPDRPAPSDDPAPRPQPRQALYLDGRHRRVFDEIFTYSLQFFPNGKWLLFVGRDGTQVHVALDTGEAVTLSKAYAEVARPGPVISPDNRHMAYVVSDGDRRYVVRNNRAQPAFENIDATSLVFSPDSKRLAYAARNGEKAFAVIDGKPLQSFDAVINNGYVVQFGPRSRRYAYFVKQGVNVHAVVDGKVQPRPFERTIVNGSCFSPDGENFAYVAYFDKHFYMVRDGIWQKRYEKIVRPLFGPDGARFAYAVAEGEYQRVILDGEEQPRYWGVSPSLFAFSPDGKRFAYGAHIGREHYLVVDGSQGPTYLDLGEKSLRWTPDGKHFAFVAATAEGWRVIRDREAEEPFAEIRSRSLALGPDGAHAAYVVAEDGWERVVVDGVPGARWEKILIDRAGGIVFDGPRRLHYLALRQPDPTDSEERERYGTSARVKLLYLVEETLVVSP